MPRSLVASSAIEAQDATPRTPQSQGQSVTPHGAVENGPRPLCRSAVAASFHTRAREREAGRALKKGALSAGSPMRERTSAIRDDLAAAGLLPDGDHTVVGPGGVSLPATTSRQHERRKARLDHVSRGQLYEGGWHVVSIKGGDEEGGVTSHRGVLHPDEYVDYERLVGLVEDALGFSYDDVRAVYRQGRLSDTQRELRDRIDARLLALSRAGGNIVELGRVLGLRVRTDRPGGGDDCPVLDSALRRARAAELSTTERSSA